MRLRVLSDPGGHCAHFVPGSEYAGRVWLPVVGPARWTAWQVLARNAAIHSGGWTTSLEELSALVGLGSPQGNQAGIARAIRRLERFRIVRWVRDDMLVVRCSLPFITAAQLERLPAVVQAVHHQLHDRHRVFCPSRAPRAS
jgi:hypothetical protein